MQNQPLATSAQPPSRALQGRVEQSASLSLPVEWIERLFARMAAFYGAKFADAWRGVDPAEVKAAWGEELAGYSIPEIQAGIAGLKTRDWPPTLPEFLKLCRPPLDYEMAYGEALRELPKHREGRATWSQPEIYWAAVRIGDFDLRNNPYKAIANRWKAELDRAIAEGLTTIPEPKIALPAPGQTTVAPEVVKARFAAMDELRKKKQEELDRVELEARKPRGIDEAEESRLLAEAASRFKQVNQPERV